jgi:hypothetical protein
MSSFPERQCGVLVSPDQAGLDAEGPLHHNDGVVLHDHLGENLAPAAVAAPRRSRLWAVFLPHVALGQIPPRHTGLGPPQDRVITWR